MWSVHTGGGTKTTGEISNAAEGYTLLTRKGGIIKNKTNRIPPGEVGGRWGQGCWRLSRPAGK